MNFFRWLVDPTLQTVLAQIMRSLHVFVPARLPRSRTVELFRKLSCHIFHQHKRTSLDPSPARLFRRSIMKRQRPDLHRTVLIRCHDAEAKHLCGEVTEEPLSDYFQYHNITMLCIILCGVYLRPYRAQFGDTYESVTIHIQQHRRHRPNPSSRCIV